MHNRVKTLHKQRERALGIGLCAVPPPVTTFVPGLDDVGSCQVVLETGSECFVPALKLLPSCVVVVGLWLVVVCGLMVVTEDIPEIEPSVELEVVDVEIVPIIGAYMRSSLMVNECLITIFLCF